MPRTSAPHNEAGDGWPQPGLSRPWWCCHYYGIDIKTRFITRDCAGFSPPCRALTAGAWGLEWYFGYKHAHSDLSCQDWRSRDLFWDQCRHALDFFSDNEIPYWRMEPCDGISSSGYCFASHGELYVLFIPSGGTVDLQLGEGNSEVSWFDPRNGGESQDALKTLWSIKSCFKMWIPTVKRKFAGRLNSMKPYTQRS